MKTKLFITGLAMMASTMMISAQTPGNRPGKGQGNGTSQGLAYVDKNKDGVCDNYKKRNANVTLNKGNRNGKCYGSRQGRGQSKGQVKGRNFVDVNKNGVCDNLEARK